MAQCGLGSGRARRGTKTLARLAVTCNVPTLGIKRLQVGPSEHRMEEISTCAWQSSLLVQR